jgi:hypothetical protein
MKIKISQKLYRKLWEILSPDDFDLNNPYDRDLAKYLGKTNDE